MFPFARQIIAGVTADGGYPPFMLDPIDFGGVYAARKAQENGMRTVGILVKGPGSGREAAMRAIHNAGFKVSYIRDITPIPHNGCRPPKRRRV